ncbi:UNVERIFIED_CONTAM: hypothetical protein NCL1_18591 [Trichonephila clavipes]
MRTRQPKVQWLMEFKSVTHVQRRVRREWNVDSPNIRIYPPIGKNLKGDGNFGISNWQVFLSFRDRSEFDSSVDHVGDSFCRSHNKSIRQASNDIPFCSNTLLYTRD